VDFTGDKHRKVTGTVMHMKLASPALLGSDQVNWLILWMKAEKRGPFSALEGPF